MSEFRVDRDLPYIIDTDQEVVRKLADGLGRVIGFELPGYGIVHDETVKSPHRRVHRWHQELILNAIGILNPAVQTTGEFEHEDFGDMGSGVGAHADLILSGTMHSKQEQARPWMGLRLHTTDQANGAHVILANSRPDLGVEPGDSELFDRSGKPVSIVQTLGYDGQRRINEIDVMKPIEDGSYEPLAVDNNIFYYHQRPLASVILRSRASFGPVSIHGFEAVDPDISRSVYISDLPVFSQSL